MALPSQQYDEYVSKIDDLRAYHKKRLRDLNFVMKRLEKFQENPKKFDRANFMHEVESFLDEEIPEEGPKGKIKGVAKKVYVSKALKFLRRSTSDLSRM